MTQSPEQNYKTRKIERERELKERSRPPWYCLWLRDPVARFTLVIGIFTGVLVFVGSLQWCAIRGQLNEMTAARKTTIAQIRANLRREVPQITPWTSDDKPADAGKSIAYWKISPTWTNSGSTDAIEYRGWFDIIPINHLPGHFLTDTDCPTPQPPNPPHVGTIVHAGANQAQLAKKLSVEDIAMAKQEKGYILMVGHIEYSDVFPDTPRHFNDWCELIIPTDPQTNLWSMPILRDMGK